jgi:hypothetical protein
MVVIHIAERNEREVKIMAGAATIGGGLGLYYETDPSRQNRKPPFIHEDMSGGSWQVCETEGKLIRIIAVFLNKEDAELFFEIYSKKN